MRDKENCLWTIVPSDNFRDSIMIKCFRHLWGVGSERDFTSGDRRTEMKKRCDDKRFPVMQCTVCGFQKDGDKKLRVGDGECRARKNYGGFKVSCHAVSVCSFQKDSDKRLRVGDGECRARKNYGGFGVLMPSIVHDVYTLVFFWPATNPLFELSRLFGGCHLSSCLPWTAALDYKNHYRKRHQGARLRPDGAMRSRRRIPALMTV